MPMNYIPSPALFYKIFYAITGVSLIALFWGFSKCLFDISQISACADHAEYAFTVFKAVGDHIVHWFIALCQEILGRQAG